MKQKMGENFVIQFNNMKTSTKNLNHQKENDWKEGDLWHKFVKFVKPSSDSPNRLIYTDFKSNFVFDM